MRLITLNLPQPYIDGLEQLVQDELYPNRSEAIRQAVRDMIRREHTFRPRGI
ncbi:MAG: ribbon-helix-helix domain-containing protein [Promethearchaeota archaeon]